ncbi:MAG TPA: GtrA family protein [Allosphingosinicella sp.]|nr:GtrA family protein [Allosphingosinicella sp.]
MNEAGALKSLAGQFLRFGMVGGFVTLLGVAAYYVPATYLGFAPLLANLFGYAVAAALGYIMHSRISFRGHGSRDNPAQRTFRFLIVSLVSLGLNSLFVGVLTGPLGGPTWWPVIPMVFVTPLVTFSLNRHWVFGS